MLSYTEQRTQFGDLSNNTTADNLTRGTKLANIEQKYLLQKYFSNEASYSILTVGGVDSYITATVAIGATTATLASVWTYPTCQTIVTFSDGEQRNVTFTYNSTALTWQNALTGTQFTLTAVVASGATSATLATAWAYDTQSTLSQFSDGEQKTVTFTEGSTAITWTGGLTGGVTAVINTSIITTSIEIGGVQSYRLPPDYSKLKTETLTIGSLKWTPTEVFSREQWDNLNVFPYYADIPSNFYIWNNQFNLWPIPSTTGNVITFNYKRRIPDLSMADYATGTVSVTTGTTTITGSGTTWIPTTNSTSESRYIKIEQNKGDNLWYQIASVDSTTSLTLMSPYQGITVSGGTYNIGQMPILMEDFQDMLVWKPLMFYYSTIVKDEGKFKEFQDLYNEKLKMLDDYAGSKTVQVNLSPRRNGQNPNLYQQSLTGTN